MEQNTLFFEEQAKKIPARYGRYDIVVAGGGIGGIAAALAAARAGKKTLLIENMYALGGLATLGLITIYLPLCDGLGHQVSFGIAEELLRLSISRGYEAEYPDTWMNGEQEHGTQRFKVRYNAQIFQILAEQLLHENGVELLYGTRVTGALSEGNRAICLITENKDGRSAIPADGFVDATGDADLFVQLGAKTELYAPGNALAAWYYETVGGKNRLHPLGITDVIPEDSLIKSAAMDRDASRPISGIDARELTERTLLSHKTSIEDFLAGGDVSEAHSMTTLAMIPQVRMTRRIVGKYTMDESDAHKHMPDSIGMIGDWRKRGPVYEVPLRALYTDALVNVAAVGRCISATDPMWDVTRVIPAAAVTGQAAGAALAQNTDLTQVDFTKLQRTLRSSGVRIHLDEVF